MNQEPNDYQVAGNHYQTEDKYQLWDLFADINLNFFLANAVKYIYRCKNKNGLEDLNKAKHYIDKFFSLDIETQLKLLGNKFNCNIITDFLDKEKKQLCLNQYNLIFLICDLLNATDRLHIRRKYINTGFSHLNEELKNEINNG